MSGTRGIAIDLVRPFSAEGSSVYVSSWALKQFFAGIE